MRTGRPLAPLELHERTRKQLQSIVNSRSSPHALVHRAKVILLAADGWPNHAIARSLVGTSGAHAAYSPQIRASSASQLSPIIFRIRSSGQPSRTIAAVRFGNSPMVRMPSGFTISPNSVSRRA